jgi:hypothetical protein
MTKKTSIYHGTGKATLTDKTHPYLDTADDCGYLLLDIQEPGEQRRIKFRRADKNKDATLQFEIAITKKGRTLNSSFSVPFELTEDFLKHLQKIRQ